MFFISLFLPLIFISRVTSQDSFGMRLTTKKFDTKENNTDYLYRYIVKDDTTGDYKTQEEIKEGDSVKGSYTIAEPNGDLRTVTYKADPKRGFEATVDILPSASPMKSTYNATPKLQATTFDPITNFTKTEKATLKSNVKHFPGGFLMDILSKSQLPSDKKVEIKMKFSMNTNLSKNATSFTHGASKITTEEPNANIGVTESIAMKNLSENYETIHMNNTSNLTEARDIEETVEKEINEAMNFMPKLPEIILPDNTTLFKFHKDPEEALLDERITQIARQLAETSLRKEYEERKLGHFIPISVIPIERSTSSYSSKPLKLEENNKLRPSDATPVHVLTKVRLLPEFTFKDTFFSRLSSLSRRLPFAVKPISLHETPEEASHKVINNTLEELQKNTAPNSTKKINEMVNAEATKFVKTVGWTPVTVVPLRLPQILHLFTPVQPYTIDNSETINDFTTGTIFFEESKLNTNVSKVKDEQATNNSKN